MAISSARGREAARWPSAWQGSRADQARAGLARGGGPCPKLFLSYPEGRLALETLIARFGLAAVFVGAGIEGEAVAITGGVLAQNGLLPVWGVVIAAGTGACLADQLWFWFARHYAQAQWVKKVERRPAFQRALRILEHHLILFTLGFRFIYGMRTVTPIAISASHIRSRTFVMLNAISAALWAVLMVWAGYLFGQTIQPWLHRIKSATLLIFAVGGVVLIIAMSPRLLRWWRRRRSDARASTPG